MKNKAIFLDRDGTIIIDKIFLNDPAQVEYLPKVFDGLRELQNLGYYLIVVTNQSGVPRGLVSLENIYRTHQFIRNDFSKKGVEFKDFYFAPYSVDSEHPMRKPGTGMLEVGIKKFSLNPEQCWMVGDKMSDVEAGHRMSMKCALLKHGDSPSDSSFSGPDLQIDNLLQLATHIKKNQL